MTHSVYMQAEAVMHDSSNRVYINKSFFEVDKIHLNKTLVVFDTKLDMTLPCPGNHLRSWFSHTRL